MLRYELTKGEGRSKVILILTNMGGDLVVYIYNQNAHIGAVAVGDYDFEHNRASVSVITRLGHKDDAIAQKAAHAISKSVKKPVCVIAGIHLDNITKEEISEMIENERNLVDKFKRTELGRFICS